MSSYEKLIKLIFGKRGSGKTVLAQSLIKDQARWLVYDTLGEYETGVIVEDLPTLKSFWKEVYWQKFKIIYQPLDPEGEFDTICELVWECQNMTFLVEEVDRYSRPLAMSLPMKEVVQRGRHRSIELIGVTQRPHIVDRLITSQAKEMFIFSTTEPRDIQYFKDTIGGNVEDKIVELKEYEFVHQQDKSNELTIEKVKIDS